MAQRLGAAGAEVVWDHEIAGVKRFFTFDPWGNRLELIACAPSQKLDRIQAASGGAARRPATGFASRAGLA